MRGPLGNIALVDRRSSRRPGTAPGCSLELHCPERLPPLARALALLHPIAVLTQAGPGRSEFDGSLIGHVLCGEDNPPGPVLDSPDENLALAVPVPERQPLCLRVPTVERLPRIRGFTVPHDVSVSNELPVEYPLEAVLVRRLAVG